jgi:hypothetical protein
MQLRPAPHPLRFDEPDSGLGYLLTPADTLDEVSPAEIEAAALLTAEVVLRASERPVERRKTAEDVPARLA